ncbi:sulfate ABC transporter substrate-binding protein [Streptomyces sp. NPDC047028]|uniref:sulfate ABC transporter substrate-binding protein n=1 Tax=Streptomyces sp. NPDC047028 TaxID=3155793 RepID=UPI0034019E03
MNLRRLPRPVASLAAVVSVLALAVGCSSAGGSSAGGSGKINLVAYSTPQEVYEELIPEFAKTEAGKGVKVSTSFGASGAQSRAVVAGQPADVVEFSLETDLTRLVDEGLVSKDWNKNEYNGMLTDSVVVFIVRKDNPKNIRSWSDLTKPGVKVVTPNPFSSGSARWNLMAAYGAALKQRKSPDEALAFVKSVLKNTVAQPESGSKATAAFTSGTGDVLISYENEALEAQRAKQDVDYVIPDQTLLIENPVAALSKSANAEQAKAFVKYLYTEQAQKTFAEHGYRPVVKSVLDEKKFPTPKQLFTIRDLGGWPKVAKEFFDTKTGSITKIENELGVSGG